MNRDTLKEWFRAHLCEETLPRWLASAALPSGLFHAPLDRQWRRIESAQPTLVSQCRFLYDFAAGWRHTGDERYRNAVEAGVRFLLPDFVDPSCPGTFFGEDPVGDPVKLRRDAYGHAFAVFGLGHTAHTLGEGQYHELAHRLLDLVRLSFLDCDGHPADELTGEFSRLNVKLSQNPLMHLFEANLALIDLSGPEESLLTSAEQLASFVHLTLGDAETGRLPELYDENWQPLRADAGGRIDIGHAMEWSFLLSRGVQLGLAETWLPVAERLLEHGLEVGEDSDGGLFSNEYPQGGVIPGDKGWWQQCELIRALIHFATVRGRDDLWPKVGKHLDYVRRRFIDAEYGGWYATPGREDGVAPANSDKGNPWKVGYHVTAMCEEALRVL